MFNVVSYFTHAEGAVHMEKVRSCFHAVSYFANIESK